MTTTIRQQPPIVPPAPSAPLSPEESQCGPVTVLFSSQQELSPTVTVQPLDTQSAVQQLARQYSCKSTLLSSVSMAQSSVCESNGSKPSQTSSPIKLLPSETLLVKPVSTELNPSTLEVPDEPPKTEIKSACLSPPTKLSRSIKEYHKFVIICYSREILCKIFLHQTDISELTDLPVTIVKSRKYYPKLPFSFLEHSTELVWVEHTFFLFITE